MSYRRHAHEEYGTIPNFRGRSRQGRPKSPEDGLPPSQQPKPPALAHPSSRPPLIGTQSVSEILQGMMGTSQAAKLMDEVSVVSTDTGEIGELSSSSDDGDYFLFAPGLPQEAVYLPNWEDEGLANGAEGGGVVGVTDENTAGGREVNPPQTAHSGEGHFPGVRHHDLTEGSFPGVRHHDLSATQWNSRPKEKKGLLKKGGTARAGTLKKLIRGKEGKERKGCKLETGDKRLPKSTLIVGGRAHSQRAKNARGDKVDASTVKHVTDGALSGVAFRFASALTNEDDASQSGPRRIKDEEQLRQSYSKAAKLLGKRVASVRHMVEADEMEEYSEDEAVEMVYQKDKDTNGRFENEYEMKNGTTKFWDDCVEAPFEESDATSFGIEAESVHTTPAPNRIFGPHASSKAPMHMQIGGLGLILDTSGVESDASEFFASGLQSADVWDSEMPGLLDELLVFSNTAADESASMLANQFSSESAGAEGPISEIDGAEGPFSSECVGAEGPEGEFSELSADEAARKVLVKRTQIEERRKAREQRRLERQKVISPVLSPRVREEQGSDADESRRSGSRPVASPSSPRAPAEGYGVKAEVSKPDINDVEDTPRPACPHGVECPNLRDAIHSLEDQHTAAGERMIVKGKEQSDEDVRLSPPKRDFSSVSRFGPLAVFPRTTRRPSDGIIQIFQVSEPMPRPNSSSSLSLDQKTGTATSMIRSTSPRWMATDLTSGLSTSNSADASKPAVSSSHNLSRSELPNKSREGRPIELRLPQGIAGEHASPFPGIAFHQELKAEPDPNILQEMIWNLKEQAMAAEEVYRKDVENLERSRDRYEMMWKDQDSRHLGALDIVKTITKELDRVQRRVQQLEQAFLDAGVPLPPPLLTIEVETEERQAVSSAEDEAEGGSQGTGRVSDRLGGDGDSRDAVEIIHHLRVAPGIERGKKYKGKKKKGLAGVFGETLAGIVTRQKANGYPHLDLPLILPVLASAFASLGGFESPHVFATPIMEKDLLYMKKQFNKGDYSTNAMICPHHPAALLKRWLLELREPVVPASYYFRFLRCKTEAEREAFVPHLPRTNSRVFIFLLGFMEKLCSLDSLLQTGLTPKVVAQVFSGYFVHTPLMAGNPKRALESRKLEQAAIESFLADRVGGVNCK